jgi:drug/metabolite transporter (DMT)-like permease
MLTAAALIAFAANSILCRLALREAAIDPASFTIIRFLSGAIALLLVTARMPRRTNVHAGSWASAFVLTLYALPFAFAYTQLSAGTGALILFGCVQITMLLAAVGTGERPRPRQWAGVAAALAGLIYLVLPGLSAPPLVAAVLMATAGVCWGWYSLRGRGATNPLQQTAANFVRGVPLIAAASLPWMPRATFSARGVLLAVASGTLASGLGYVAWYSALRRLTGLQAAVVQLAVPLIAAAGGVLLLSETLTPRLMIATVLVLGGIGLAVVSGRRESGTPASHAASAQPAR